jgi:hypothetical protein
MCHHAHLLHEQTTSAANQASLLPLPAILIEPSPQASQARN